LAHEHFMSYCLNIEQQTCMLCVYNKYFHIRIIDLCSSMEVWCLWYAWMNGKLAGLDPAAQMSLSVDIVYLPSVTSFISTSCLGTQMCHYRMNVTFLLCFQFAFGLVPLIYVQSDCIRTLTCEHQRIRMNLYNMRTGDGILLH
jgi:hypothetical protein